MAPKKQATEEPSTRDIALQRAVALLTASGVDWLVVKDGGEHGPLAGRVKITTGRTKRSRDGMAAAMREKYGWREKLEACAPGDAVNIVADTVEEARRMTTNMTAWASAHWGNGSYISRCVGINVEILRVL